MGLTGQRLFRAVLILVLGMAVCGCVRREGGKTPAPAWPAEPKAGAFFLASGESLALSGMAARAGEAAYILIGEGHTSVCDHVAQAEAIRALAGAGVKPAIGLEMVPADKQPVLDAFNSGTIPLADLPGALEWERIWGYDFTMYAEIFALARKHGLPVFAANAPREAIRQASERGLDKVAPEMRGTLPAAVIPAPLEQEKSLREMFEGHIKIAATPPTPERKAAKSKAKPPKPAEQSLTRFMFVQALWDTQMAERAMAARLAYARPVVVLAGGGHVEYGYGIAHRLKILDPGANVFSVMPWRGGTPPEPGEADAYFFCPVSHKSRLGFVVEMRSGTALVVEVVPGSRADQAGLLLGDAIAKAGEREVKSLFDLHLAAVEAAKAGKPLVFTVTRASGSLNLSFDLPGPAGQDAAKPASAGTP